MQSKAIFLLYATQNDFFSAGRVTSSWRMQHQHLEIGGSGVTRVTGGTGRRRATLLQGRMHHHHGMRVTFVIGGVRGTHHHGTSSSGMHFHTSLKGDPFWIDFAPLHINLLCPSYHPLISLVL